MRRQFHEVYTVHAGYVMLRCNNVLVDSISAFLPMFMLRLSELEASRTAADAQAAKQAQLEKQLEAALLDKKRLQDLDSGKSYVCSLFSGLVQLSK